MRMPTITSLSPTSGPTTGNQRHDHRYRVHWSDDSAIRQYGNDFHARFLDADHGDRPCRLGRYRTGRRDHLGGTSNGVSYTYVAVPALTTISPSQGSTAGRTTVTLTGAGLTGVTAVSFGGTPATSFTVDSDTQITAVAAAGTGIVSVTLTGPGGISSPVTYTYAGVPAITSLSPASGPTAGGNNVTITGTGFTGPLTVRFGTTATTFTVNSVTQITAAGPAHAAGAVQVTVTVTGSGGASNGVVYAYM